jgi:hypothetical protein
MKYIILLLVLCLCGCTYVVPNDTEFLTVVDTLDTPALICDYMTDNFVYEAHLWDNLTPIELFYYKKGDCNDFSTFGQFAANFNGINAYEVIISYSNTWVKHALCVYEDYTYSDTIIYIPTIFSSIYDIVEYESKFIFQVYGYLWKSYKVYDIDNNLIEMGEK